MSKRLGTRGSTTWRRSSAASLPRRRVARGVLCEAFGMEIDEDIGEGESNDAQSSSLANLRENPEAVLRGANPQAE